MGCSCNKRRNKTRSTAARSRRNLNTGPIEPATRNVRQRGARTAAATRQTERERIQKLRQDAIRRSIKM